MASIEIADDWMREGAALALSRLPIHSSDWLLRFIKATTEILFWHKYVSAGYRSAANIQMCAQLETSLAWDDLLSVFRYNPAIETLFYPLAAASWSSVSPDTKRDMHHLAEVLRMLPRERTAFRILDVLHGRAVFGFRDERIDDVDVLLRHGCANTEGTLPFLDDGDLYALTHTVFYLTDFGAKRLSPGAQQRLYDITSFALIDAIANKDYDLTSELVLALMFMSESSVCIRRAIEFLRDGQQEDGAWHPMQNVAESVRASDIEERHQAFFSNYHTTLLARDCLARANLLGAPPAFHRALTITREIRRPDDSRRNEGIEETFNLNADRWEELLCDAQYFLVTVEGIAACADKMQVPAEVVAQLKEVLHSISGLSGGHYLRMRAAICTILGLQAASVPPANWQDPYDFDLLVASLWRRKLSRSQEGMEEEASTQLRLHILNSICDQNVLAFAVLVPHVEKAVESDLVTFRQFHTSMCSRRLGYGYINPTRSDLPRLKELMALLWWNVEAHLALLGGNSR